MDYPKIPISITHNCYCSIYWWKTCFLAKYGPSKDGKSSFLKNIQKMISETIDSVNKIYFLTQIHCLMSGNILWNLILAQPGCVTMRMVKTYFLHQIFRKALERPFKWHIGKFCSICRKNVTLHNRKSLTFCPIIVDLRHCDPDVQKSDSGFGPRDHYLSTVGLNPAVYTSCSGFTPRDHNLATVGLNPYVHKSDSGFTPRDDYLVTVGLNPADHH